MKVEQANYIKAIFTAVFAFLSALLGVLAVPVILLVACNLIDYDLWQANTEHRISIPIKVSEEFSKRYLCGCW